MKLWEAAVIAVIAVTVVVLSAIAAWNIAACYDRGGIYRPYVGCLDPKVVK